MKSSLTIVSAIALAAWATAVQMAAAQSTLERFETQIRQRIASSGRETIGAATSPMAGGAPHRAGTSGYLGLMADDGTDRGRGVRVLEIQPGGPAEKAGLRRQDLITAIDSVRVRQISDMTEVLSTFAPGQSVDFDILRDASPQKLHVVLGRHPNAAARPASLPSAESPEPVPLPPGEAIPEPPLAQLAGPTLAAPKGAEPVISTNARLEQFERRLDGLERRVGEIEKALKKRTKD